MLPSPPSSLARAQWASAPARAGRPARCPLRRGPWLGDRVRDRVARQDERGNSQTQDATGRQQQPRRPGHRLGRLGDQPAPARRGRHDPEAEEGQPTFCHQRRAREQPGLHDDGRGDLGQHVPQYDLRMRQPGDPRGPDVQLPANLQGDGPHHPDKAGRGDQAEDGHRREQGTRKNGENDQQDHQHGQRQQQVRQPADNRVGGAARIPGDHPERDPGCQPRGHRGRHPRQRGPGAGQQLAEHIAAQLVGAQQVPCRRAGQHRRQILGLRVIRVQDRREHRAGDDHAKPQRARHAQWAAGESPATRSRGC